MEKRARYTLIPRNNRYMNAVASRFAPVQTTNPRDPRCSRCGSKVAVLVSLAAGRKVCEGCAYGRPK